VSAIIEIAVESPRWEELSSAEDVVRGAIGATLTDCGEADVEVSVALADDTQIRELNRHWRGKDTATNVLSFPVPDTQPGETRFLGDIILAFETIEREAADEAKPLAHHVAHLAVHGTLHLLGYDHENDSDADAMERRERDILARIGVPDPYASGAARRTEPA
jgi:probable rRNA maturation factor